MISICITAYKRPDKLKELLDSCFNQTYQGPYEVIVSDDTPDDTIKNLIASLGYNIRYFHHQPGLRQAQNVNFAFKQASGDRLILIHDDDRLRPNCLEDLNAEWERIESTGRKPIFVFGDQFLIDDDGTPLESVNHRYDRVSANQGEVAHPRLASLRQMFPCNGYMIATDIAQVHLMRPEQGNICDLDFLIRIAHTPGVYSYINTFVSDYRVSAISETNSGIEYDKLIQTLCEQPEIKGDDVYNKKLKEFRTTTAVKGIKYILKKRELRRLRPFISHLLTV
jgi:glycosyltransferase involved in cell wall biosynthesis